MARFGRGLICLTLTAERCRQLRLPLMVSETHREHRTNFTLSIEAAEGVTTGISAHDRAHTVITAVKPNARPEDLRQPGHIFPVMAQPGGVLTRAGHTEAGCDLARLAGLDASAVIVEIMNDDGTMARRPDLEAFAEPARAQDRHHRRPDPLPAAAGALGGAHRRAAGARPSSASSGCSRTKTTCIATCTWRWCAARSKGAAPPLVRVHPIDTLSDLVGVRGAGRTWTLRAAHEAHRRGGHAASSSCCATTRTPRELADAVSALGQRAEHAAAAQAAPQVLRTYGIGAQILKDLGVTRMQVLSAPKQLQGISAFGLEITGYVAEMRPRILPRP